VVLALALLSGLAVLVLGQDDNTDLRRYRFYIGYAFVHGRLDDDLAPAALGTYLNPVLDAVNYLGIAHLPPRVFGFLLGALQGLNPALVFLMARRLLGNGRGIRLPELLVALLAATGSTARSLLGTTMGDTVASIPALLALLLVLEGLGKPNRPAGAALLLLGAGWLGGVGVALKLTMGPYLVALAAVIAVMTGRRSVGARAAAAFVAGAVLGFLTLGGYWCWQMWERFGNPLFPFANQLFRSPYLPAAAIRDLRWAAKGPMDYLSPPFVMAFGATRRLQEIPFRDARFLLVVLAGLLWLVLRLARRRPPLSAAQSLLLVYVMVAYATWLVAFYYYRYAAVLEFLAPLVFVILAQAAIPRLARPVLLGAGVLVLLTASGGSWLRHGWWDRWWRVRLPPQAQVPDCLVLLDSPLSSFLIPYFPRETRFAGLEWSGSPRIEELLTERIGSHRGTFMVLMLPGRSLNAANLKRLGLTGTEDCGLIRTGSGKHVLCRVVRAEGLPPASSAGHR
jgi:hypothetical protein